MIMAAILLVPALAFLWSLWGKFSDPVPPEPFALSATGFGALLINSGCALLLARFRSHGGSLTRAVFLSARNDTVANIAIIVAGLVTGNVWSSVWPDVVAGLAIAVMNLDAAREVWEAAHEEHTAQS
jgi:Co/Zn/Cd efflux system component